MARFPSEKERIAMERGGTELWELVRWHYKDEPRRLKKLHKAYAVLCCLLYEELERVRNESKLRRVP